MAWRPELRGPISCRRGDGQERPGEGIAVGPSAYKPEQTEAAIGINLNRVSGAEFDSARKTVEQFEAKLLFQILNLPGERRLGYAKPLRAAPVMDEATAEISCLAKSGA